MATGNVRESANLLQDCRRISTAPENPAVAGSATRSSSRTSPPRRKPSFTSSWPARRVSSTCSTTSRSWSKYEGKPMPPEVIGGQRYAFIRSDAAVLGPAVQVCETRPVRGRAVRDAAASGQASSTTSAIVKVVRTDQFNHAPAQIFFNTGFSQPGRPSLGSWVLYGLGAETSELPAFVVMSTGSGISGGAANWSSGFLPSHYTGVRLRNQGDPILNVSSPPGVDRQLAARHARSGEPAESPAARGRRSRDRHAHRVVRNGVPAATSAPELIDLLQRRPEDARPVRLRSR
jgi:hypothetical protein